MKASGHAPSSGALNAAWRAGDVAECIDTGDLQTGGHRPHVAMGGRYLRLRARYAVLGTIGEPGEELVLDLGLRTGPKLARRFRKVPPKAEGKAAERSAPVSPVAPGLEDAGAPVRELAPA